MRARRDTDPVEVAAFVIDDGFAVYKAYSIKRTDLYAFARALAFDLVYNDLHRMFLPSCSFSLCEAKGLHRSHGTDLTALLKL